MDVSENNGTPKSSHFNRDFHYKPSILGYPYFWKHPHGWIFSGLSERFLGATVFVSRHGLCHEFFAACVPHADLPGSTSPKSIGRLGKMRDFLQLRNPQTVTGFEELVCVENCVDITDFQICFSWASCWMQDGCCDDLICIRMTTGNLFHVASLTPAWDHLFKVS